MREEFVFGYGSLISDESRKGTSSCGSALCLRVHGYQRRWNAFPGLNWCPLAAVPHKSSSLNGVIFPVSRKELRLFDEREFGYRREPVPAESIELLDGRPFNGGQVWIYVADETFTPHLEVPIIQSYIDVSLSGCLEYSINFALEFIRSTYGWQFPWLDDRAQPYYVRAHEKVPRREEIEGILCEALPREYQQRLVLFPDGSENLQREDFIPFETVRLEDGHEYLVPVYTRDLLLGTSGKMHAPNCQLCRVSREKTELENAACAIY